MAGRVFEASIATGKSTCTNCKQVIAEGSLTISMVTVYDDAGTKGSPMFRHPNCYNVKMVTTFNDLLTANNLEGFAELKAGDQDELRQLFEDVISGRTKAEKKAQSKRKTPATKSSTKKAPKKQKSEGKKKEKKPVVEGGKKLTRKKKVEKDPNKPKNKMNAYMFFNKDNQKQMKAENPEMKITEISKLLGAKWKAMSDEEKKPYTDQAAADKTRFEEEIKVYYEENPESAPAAKKKAAPKKRVKKKVVKEEEAEDSSSSSSSDSSSSSSEEGSDSDSDSD